jgi:hypothetical protein
MWCTQKSLIKNPKASEPTKHDIKYVVFVRHIKLDREPQSTRINKTQLISMYIATNLDEHWKDSYLVDLEPFCHTSVMVLVITRQCDQFLLVFILHTTYNTPMKYANILLCQSRIGPESSNSAFLGQTSIVQ